MMTERLAEYLRGMADRIEASDEDFDGCILHLTRSHDMAVRTDSYNPTTSGDAVDDMIAGARTVDEEQFNEVMGAA